MKQSPAPHAEEYEAEDISAVMVTEASRIRRRPAWANDYIMD